MDTAVDDPVARGAALAARGDFEAAAQVLREAAARWPERPAAHTNLGNALLQLRHVDEAIACHRRALALQPDLPPALGNLGLALVDAGRAAEAVAVLDRAVSVQPDNAVARHNLGLARQRLGDWEGARLAFAAAVELHPGLAASWCGLGMALVALGAMTAAIDCHRRAAALEPGRAGFHNNLGNALHRAGDVAGAVACHLQAIALAPADPAAYANLGNELQELGQFDAAFTAFERASAQSPRCAQFHLALAQTGRVAPGSPQMTRMLALAAEIERLTHAEQSALHFALGEVLDGAGDIAAAFRHFQAGNALQRRLIAYDEAAALAEMRAIAAAFSPAVLARPGVAAPGVPVFVVGMARSGTTLVEQILASHQAVFGAGELTDWPRLVAGLGGAAVVPDAAAAEHLAAAYLGALRARAPDAARVVDKLPDNFLRIGQIITALPAARIIHVRRDPVETCLSCYTKLFPGALPYSYDLAELGRYYRGYDALMAHWRAALPAGVMLELEYESLIADFPAQVARMLAHCGLDWDDRCLNFAATARPVRTASALQVRGPLTRSTRWQPYRGLAGALVAALREGRLGGQQPDF